MRFHPGLHNSLGKGFVYVVDSTGFKTLRFVLILRSSREEDHGDIEVDGIDFNFLHKS